MKHRHPTLAPARLVAVTSATAALDAALFDRNREGFIHVTAPSTHSLHLAKPDTSRRKSKPPQRPPASRPHTRHQQRASTCAP